MIGLRRADAYAISARLVGKGLEDFVASVPINRTRQEKP